MAIQILFSRQKKTWKVMQMVELGLKCIKKKKNHEKGQDSAFLYYHWHRLLFHSLVISEFMEHRSPYQAQILNIKLK